LRDRDETETFEVQDRDETEMLEIRDRDETETLRVRAETRRDEKNECLETFETETSFIANLRLHTHSTDEQRGGGMNIVATQANYEL